eukprot:gene8456-11434_t
MAKGMWTKQLTREGSVFYFNASQNRSLWHPPPDSVVHEANELSMPQSNVSDNIDSLDQNQRNEEAYLAFTKQALEDGEVTRMSDAHDNTKAKKRSIHQIDNETIGSFPITNHSQNVPTSGTDDMARSIQEKIDQAVQRKQQMVSKRFKTVNNDSLALTDGSNMNNNGSKQSEYLKQKSELEQMAGNKATVEGKWLVR